MQRNRIYDIACIGNYTKDTIISPDGVRSVDGGAVNYAAHAAVATGCKVAVVTRLAQEDYQRVISPLENIGVDCLVRITPESTCLKLEYPTRNVDIRNLTVTSTAGSITAEEVAALRCRAAIIGASFRGEIEMDAILALRAKSRLLVADAQGFARVIKGQEIVFHPWESMPDVLRLLDIFKADGKEAEFLTGTGDLHQAAQMLASYGPKEVLITHQDGLLVYAEKMYYKARFYAQRLNGRSGRGDTCTGAYVAKRLSAPPAAATLWAAALTSLKMENEGPFRQSPSEVIDLIEQKYR